MTRLYYDCPIKAIYMIKNFSIKILGIEDDPQILCGFIERGFTKPNKYFTAGFIISPESIKVFEPQHGDLNQDGDMFNSNIMCSDPRGAWEEIGQNDSHKHDDRFDTIIYRQGKPFFMPQKEEINKSL